MRVLGRWLKRIGWTVLILAVLLALPVLPRITMPLFPAPPGADSIELVVNPGYQVNPVAEFILGTQYRDLWTQPIKVEVLDLEAFEGGVRPTREGGGQETRSLHFETTDGRRFIFRSVDKEVLRLLHAGLSRSPVAWLVHDQTSSSFPAGALVANELQAAVGLPAGTARLVVLPDHPRLGEYRERFAGVLGLVQEGHGEYRRNPPRSGHDEARDTEEVLPRVDSSSSHRLDARGYLTARILDLFLNDWDRHAGQWRWAGVPEPWGTRWMAIPVDRDQSFSSYDGVFMAIARLRTPKLAVFGPEIPSVRGLMYNSRSLDRRLLAGLERPAWDSIAAFVVTRLTDSAIAEAARKLPEPYYRLEGARLIETLKQRRGTLAASAISLYQRLAEHPEVHATLESEIVQLDHHSDGAVELRIGPASGATPAPPWFTRRFLPGETTGLDVHLGGGDDRVVVTGEPAGAIAVRMFDEKGRPAGGRREAVDGER
jgi:hypothetical protein